VNVADICRLVKRRLKDAGLPTRLYDRRQKKITRNIVERIFDLSAEGSSPVTRIIGRI
jgi:hypothetical protein